MAACYTGTMNIQTNDIGHVIQLAIAPVFLLTGVATKLTVLMNRLARIIDRTRVLDVNRNEVVFPGVTFGHPLLEAVLRAAHQGSAAVDRALQ